MKTAAETAQDNAEKAATAAAESATAAGESATAAAEIKVQIDEIKAGIDATKGEIDQAKADIDQTKTDTLTAKTAAETAAATATEKAAEIADSAAQIATNTENIGKNATGIETNATEIDLLRRENTELKAKTDALWKLSEGKSYDFVEDATEAYSKDVPTGCRFAEVEKIGGKTGAWNQWVDETKYLDVTSASVTTTISGRRIVIVGTSGSNGENFNIIDRSTKIWNIAANHYYLFAGINKLTGLSLSAYNGAKAVTIAYAGSTAKNAVFKPAFSGISQLYFNTGDAGVAVDVDCTPYLIDLTQLYGSGNEPTTADDPRIAEIIAYAEKHPEYNAGKLVSAGVENVEVQGTNSLDTYPIPDAVKALPGYGWSAGSVCNEIVRRADGWDYVQRVGLPATTDGYTALDTPTTTDITDLMTGALPLMATEPGGTITMHHALADDGLTLDVPSTIKYIRDLKEVASSESD